jgi:SAM-dependent methyltransferase
VLDIACGIGHPIGTAIGGMWLDTVYIGVDIMWHRAKAVTDIHARRPTVGVCHDVRVDIPMRDSTVDVICCLEGPEHFCGHDLEDYTLHDFFREVRRVLKFSGICYIATPVPDGDVLMHPHCHAEEFSETEMLFAIEEAGLECWQRFNYRARPQVAKKLRMNARDELTKGHGYPPALVDAYELPKLTYNDLIPGNAVYILGHGSSPS